MCFRPLQVLGVTPALARELLRMAEHGGALCRDVGPAGVRYHKNLFPQYVAALTA